jgi:general stress protein 26
MNDLERLASFIKDLKFTMMTTMSADGSLHSRPMATLGVDEKNFDGKLWFFTKLHSPKVNDLDQDQHINLSFADTDKQKYASVSGRASITQEKSMMEKLWNPIFKAWFPEGLEDPDIALISVTVESADLWDSPPGKVVQLAGFVKSQLTGRPYDGSHDKEHMDVNRTH